MPAGSDATRRAVVLLSGGLDSFTAAAMTRAEGYELYALSIRYGQIHAREIEAARAVARVLGVARHLELAVDLAAFGGSALVGDGAIPKDRALESDHSIPSTYVPARNTVFLSLALAWAEVVGATAIVIGVNALDYSGYPDCRPEYLEAFERMADARDQGRRRGPPAPDSRPVAALVEGRHHPPRHHSRAGLRRDAQLLRSGRLRRAVRPLRQLPPASEGLRGGGCQRPFARSHGAVRSTTTVRPTPRP